MATNTNLSNVTSKAAFAGSSASNSPQHLSTPGVAQHVCHQKRAGGSQAAGSGSWTRSSSSSPRNSQHFRRQHKGQRRPKLTDEGSNAETDAMQSTKSRKGRQSITHLLNYTVSSQLDQQRDHRNNYHSRHNVAGVRRTATNPSWGLGSGYHAADKARYIHANYRFIVKADGDYRAQMLDADVHLDWSDVLQILVSPHSQASNCPICLSTPVSPRMAKCGHIFCLPCLIRFMYSGDEGSLTSPEKRPRWKKCPICFDSVYISDTKPVRWYAGKEERLLPRPGHDVVLRLMSRQTGTTLALPRESTAAPSNASGTMPWYNAADMLDHARMMKGSTEYLREQFQRDILDLEEQERHDELMFGEDATWTQKAIASVRESMSTLHKQGQTKTHSKTLAQASKSDQPSNQLHTGRVSRGPEETERSGPEETHLSPKLDFRSPHGANHGRSSASNNAEISDSTTRPFSATPKAPFSTQDQDSPGVLSESVPDPDRICKTGKSRDHRLDSRSSNGPAQDVLPTGQGDDKIYFYEAPNHFFLSPLDIRILKSAFGEYRSFPSTLLPRIEHVSTGHVIDDDFRRRAKYLAHLPEGSEVSILECDWTDIVPPAILTTYAAEITRRRKRNDEKEAREEKARVKAERLVEDERWTIPRHRRGSHDFQLKDRSTIDLEDDPALPSLPSASHAIDMSSSLASLSTSPFWPGSSFHARQQNGTTFDALASPSNSPNTVRTIWGTRVVAPSSPNPEMPLDEAESSSFRDHDDGWLENRDAPFFDTDEQYTLDMTGQMQESLTLDEKRTTSTLDFVEGTSNTKSQGSKKKKGKKITLMSTNARRGA